jgi:hypothetical protein
MGLGLVLLASFGIGYFFGIWGSAEFGFHKWFQKKRDSDKPE